MFGLYVSPTLCCRNGLFRLFCIPLWYLSFVFAPCKKPLGERSSIRFRLRPKGSVMIMLYWALLLLHQIIEVSESSGNSQHLMPVPAASIWMNCHRHLTYGTYWLRDSHLSSLPHSFPFHSLYDLRSKSYAGLARRHIDKKLDLIYATN